MINKTRKHISPVALLAALGVVAVLAVMAAVVWLPGSAQAQSGPSNPFAPATPTPTPGGPDNPFPQALEMPMNLRLDSASVTSLDISWDAVSGADNGYRVEYMGPMTTHSWCIAR